MQQLDSYLADRALTRQLYLMRFSAGEQKKVLAVLVDMRAELVAKLRAGDVTDFARGRLKTLLKQCEAVIDHGYGQIQTTLDFKGLAKVEAEATIRPLAAVGLEASIPTVATMKAVVNGSLIEGAKSADWWVTLHQGQTVRLLGESEIGGTMLFSLMVMLLAGLVGFVWLLIVRFRVAFLAARVDEHGLDEAIAARRAEAAPGSGRAPVPTEVS